MNLLIIIFPFFSTLCYALIFLLIQQFKKNTYLKNLIYIFPFIVIIKIYVIFKFNYFFNYHEIFYIFFVFLCNSFIFMNTIQVPISSLQVALLRIIEASPNLSEKDIQKKYNSNIVFDERIGRLCKSGILFEKKSILEIKGKKILILLKLIKFFKVLHKVRL